MEGTSRDFGAADSAECILRPPRKSLSLPPWVPEPDANRREDGLRAFVLQLAKDSVAQNWDDETYVGRVVRAVRDTAPPPPPGHRREGADYERLLTYWMKGFAAFCRAGALASYLPQRQVGGAMTSAAKDPCPICKEELAEGDWAIRMPCDCMNLYHRYCMVAWMKKKPTCPTCRFVLPLPV